MKRLLKYGFLGLAFLMAVPLFGQQQEPTLTRILFVFDASGSMLQVWDKDKKINTARNMLTKMIDSLEGLPNLQLALRVYGHQKPFPPQDCDDTKLEVPFGDASAPKIRQKLKYLTPRGTTPIAMSLEECVNDFPPCPNCRNVIILITDGIEECGGDPCAVSMALQSKGITLRPFVIGVGLDLEFRKTFECVGEFFNAEKEEEFQNVLNIVVTQVLNNTTAQINLLDITGKPTESDVNMTFYDMASGKMLHNYIHTINDRGEPDTIRLDPLVTYSVVVHTIPEIRKDSIKIISGKHNIVAIDAPQGSLLLKDGSRATYNPLQYIVRKKGDMNTLNVQKINDTEKYIVGSYDLEILTLPRIYKSNVEIKQSHTTTVQIPASGTLNLSTSTPGYGSIYVEDQGDLKWVMNIYPDMTRAAIALLPGSYKVIFRPKTARQLIYTTQKSFRIVSGGSESVRLN